MACGACTVYLVVPVVLIGTGSSKSEADKLSIANLPFSDLWPQGLDLIHFRSPESSMYMATPILGAKITGRGNSSRLPSLAKGIINFDSCITTECADPNRLTAQTLVIFQQTVGMSTSTCKKKPLMIKGIDHDTAPKLLHALHGPPPEPAACFEASSLSLLSFST